MFPYTPQPVCIQLLLSTQRAKLLEERRIGRTRGEVSSLGFEKMARTIGQRWKELNAEELERFKALAKEDTERYRQEMDAYHQGLALKGRREREERLEEACRKQQQAQQTPSQQEQYLAAAAAAAAVREQNAIDLGIGNLGQSVGGLSDLAMMQRLANSQNAAALNALTGSSIAGLQGNSLAATHPSLSYQDAMLLNYMQPPPTREDLVSAMLAKARADQANQEFLATISPTIRQQLLLAQYSGGGGSNLLSSSALASFQAPQSPPGQSPPGQYQGGN